MCFSLFVFFLMYAHASWASDGEWWGVVGGEGAELERRRTATDGLQWPCLDGTSGRAAAADGSLEPFLWWAGSGRRGAETAGRPLGDGLTGRQSRWYMLKYHCWRCRRADKTSSKCPSVRVESAALSGTRSPKLFCMTANTNTTYWWTRSWHTCLGINVLFIYLRILRVK